MTDNQNRGQARIHNVYGALSASIVLSLVPMTVFAVLATLMFVGVLVLAYIMRSREDDKESLVANHMTYIIRTIWIMSFLAILTTGAGGLYLVNNYEYGPIEPCAQSVVNDLDPANVNIADLSAMMQPCMDDFMGANRNVFMAALVMSAGPLILYLVYRLFAGLSRALKGYRMARPKAWL